MNQSRFSTSSLSFFGVSEAPQILLRMSASLGRIEYGEGPPKIESLRPLLLVDLCPYLGSQSILNPKYFPFAASTLGSANGPRVRCNGGQEGNRPGVIHLQLPRYRHWPLPETCSPTDSCSALRYKLESG